MRLTTELRKVKNILLSVDEAALNESICYDGSISVI